MITINRENEAAVCRVMSQLNGCWQKVEPIIMEIEGNLETDADVDDYSEYWRRREKQRRSL